MDVRMESPKELFESFIKTEVSSVLVADAIELYARNEITDKTDQEDFIGCYSDEAFQPIIQKAVLDVVVSILASSEVDDEAAFRSVIGLLDLEEDNEMIAKMKIIMLDELTDDACSDLNEFHEHKIRARIDFVKTLVA